MSVLFLLMNLQLITFNVNGLRSIKEYYAQSKLTPFPNFQDFLNSFEADVLCFQEHKTSVPGKLSHDLSYPKGYAAFYAFPRIPKKIGYSGVVTFVKKQSPWMPVAWYDGFSGVNDKTKVPLHDSPLLKSKFSHSELAELDSEGRCIIPTISISSYWTFIFQMIPVRRDASFVKSFTRPYNCDALILSRNTGNR